MGARSGTALKFLQWFNRLIQFLCAALILGIFCYFLAALDNHDLKIGNSVRAVTGISGAAVVYTIVALALLCCLAGLAFISAVAIVLDVAFIGAFIYIAVTNRHGAGSCDGYLDTPFGKGQSGKTAEGSGGFTSLPSFHTACRLQTAALAVAIIAIFFFILSILTEVALARHHRKAKRFGPGPDNNYTSGYGKQAAGGGFFSKLFRRRTVRHEDEDNVLPAHTTPEQLDGRQSYAGTDATAVGNHHSPDLGKPETGYGYGYAATTDTAVRSPIPAGYAEAPAQDYRYEDGTYDRTRV